MRDAVSQLQEMGERLNVIIQSAMDAIITVDRQQNIVLFNAAAEKIFRCPASLAVGGSLDRFIPERFRAAHHRHIEEFGRTGISTRTMGARLALRGLRADGEEFPIDASISQVSVGGEKLYTVILRDITDRKKAEEALEQAYHDRRSASERLEGIIRSAMDAIVTTDQDQKIVLFNHAAEQIFRCREHEAIGSPLDRFIPERFRAAHREHVRRFGETRVTTRMMGGHWLALTGLRANGEEFPIDASISQISIEGRKFYTVILRDITERKRAEEALERSYRDLRDLSAKMHEVREAERLRIARELHDELAQWLTAIKMDIAWIAGRLSPEQANVRERAHKARGLVDTTVAAVRRIASDLRPVMLDDLGLVAAVENLLHELSQRSGIVVSLDADESGVDVGEPLASALYRIAQEALTNVARHSGATEVRVEVRADGENLVLAVTDNGKGIDLEAAARSKSYGIMGMRERATTLGGSASITAAEGGGTRVEVVVPLARYRGRRTNDKSAAG